MTLYLARDTRICKQMERVTGVHLQRGVLGKGNTFIPACAHCQAPTWVQPGKLVPEAGSSLDLSELDVFVMLLRALSSGL